MSDSEDEYVYSDYEEDEEDEEAASFGGKDAKSKAVHGAETLGDQGGDSSVVRNCVGALVCRLGIRPTPALLVVARPM